MNCRPGNSVRTKMFPLKVRWAASLVSPALVCWRTHDHLMELMREQQSTPLCTSSASAQTHRLQTLRCSSTFQFDRDTFFGDIVMIGFLGDFFSGGGGGGGGGGRDVSSVAFSWLGCKPQCRQLLHAHGPIITCSTADVGVAQGRKELYG